MHNATFGRVRYTAGNILELQVLAKLYRVPPMGNARRKDSWVDALVEYLPEVKVVTWGELNDKAKYRVRECQRLLCAAIECIEQPNNPNAIQLAIMARLIVLRAAEPNMTIENIANLLGLSSDETFVCVQNWKLYQLRQLLAEAIDLTEDIA